MKELLEERWKGGCSRLELSDIKAFLQRSKCLPGKKLPGQRLSAAALLPPSSQFPSILRRTDSEQDTSALSSTTQRRVTFDLPPLPHDSTSFAASIASLDASSDETYYQNSGTEKYISKGAGLMAEFVDKRKHKSYLKLKVQRIPEVCLRELLELGSLDRVMLVYTKELGRLAINNYRPFRSMYFHSLVFYHTGKHLHGFEDVAKVCESAVVLNNATVPIKSKEADFTAIPNLLSFLDLGVDSSRSPPVPVVDGDSSRIRDSWEDISRARMEYAMPVGQLIATADDPAVLQLISQHISERCVIRPVYNYMYQRYVETRSTHLPVINNDLQFQIYSTTREVLQMYHGPNPCLTYVMYTTLFAIVETNEIIVREVVNASGSASEIRPTVYGESEDDADSDEDTVDDQKLSEPLADKELLSLLDWDLAAVIGYVLAQRYHKSDESATVMRAKLGALAFGVDLEKEQPFPPILPLQDTQFHQYIRQYVSAVYGKWPHGFVYMVIDEAVDAYNAIIKNIRENI
ncbi:hypothetical protein IW140_004154 [Coemansia sp. RSA 1813]|nr:hypothetical protein EV178_004144 [Coemansia sp. RSA 1646]KAJ1770934.1 hypothetical protein LPJ74_002733 [Coemansia sp. RSA 1843]KAJ2088253.1 hypothetical protein IW138_004329 [Coemansia sp. RSA 986]KAJ2213263.1 hypothetical protein EV179_003954 [Coemansia sp. RSA 487]KAJ2568156.1 hypothetical protein IW140_004154 [Coemansia sp. RSA 1813]